MKPKGHFEINWPLAMDDFQSLLKNVKKPTENQSMLSKCFGLKEMCCSIFLKSWIGTNPNQPHMFRRACDYCFQCWIACHVENESVSPAPFLINTTVLFSLEWTHLWSIQLSTCLSSSSFFLSNQNDIKITKILIWDIFYCSELCSQWWITMEFDTDNLIVTFVSYVVVL